MLLVDYRTDERVVVTEARGRLEVAQVAAWAKDLRHAYAEARAQGSVVRHLVIASEAAIQSQDVMDALIAARVPMTGAGDRMAVVVGSALAMLQAKRNLPDSCERAFTSEPDARAWLSA